MDDSMMTQAPDDMGPGEEAAEGNSLTFNVAEYPQLEGVKPGASVSIKCTGTVGQAQGGQVTISIEGQCEIETESPATREYNQMRGADKAPAGDSGNVAADDDF